MNRRTRFAALLAVALAGAASAASLPGTWRAQDAATAEATLYGVETGRYLSPALAAAQQRVLQDLGWGVVTAASVGKETSIIVGATPSLAEAYGLEQELREQAIADGRVVRLPAGSVGSVPEGIVGPRYPAFRAPMPEERPGHDELLREVQSLREFLSPGDYAAVSLSLELWGRGDTWQPEMGAGALAAAKAMVIAGRNPRLVLALVEPVAAGDWAATPQVRQACAGMVAEMRIALGDIRAALAAIAALERMPGITAETRALCHLRRAAVDASLLAAGEDPRPTTAHIRARLMDAYAAAPEEALRTRARIALLYMQTLAWDGEWDRLRDVGQEFAQRYRDVEGVLQAGQLLLARTFERDSDWRAGAEMLDRVLAAPVAPENALRVGTREIAVRETARLWRDWYNAHRWGAEPGERPPDLLFKDEVPAPPPSRFAVPE